MPGPTIVPTTQAAEVPIDPLLQKPSAPAPNRAGVVHRLLKKGARFGIEHEMFRSIQAVIDTGRARDLDAAPSTYSSWLVSLSPYYQLLALTHTSGNASISNFLPTFSQLLLRCLSS